MRGTIHMILNLNRKATKRLLESPNCPFCNSTIRFKQEQSIPIEIAVNVINMIRCNAVFQRQKQVIVCDNCGYQSKIKTRKIEF